jgi:SAM-dependent methyltransferase
MGKPFGVNVVIGIPSFGMVSSYFYQAMKGQQFPLVSSAYDKIVLNKPIAEARNEIVEFALGQGANYIFWVDDDVIPPPDSFLKLYMHQKDIINGVYWSKSNPPMPLLFRNHLEGPYLDWHVGDLIEIDAAGNGLTLVKTDVYRKISETVGGPWYSTEYTSFKNGTVSSPNNTEDLYFYWKAKQAGFKIWADTSVQAFHYEKINQVLYGMPMNAPQSNPAWKVNPKGDKLIADIGSGPVSPYFEEGKVVSFDIREDVRPDVICDVRHLPVPDQTFDIVFSSHTLEHFGWANIEKVIKEWSRVLKVGGELRLVVPNMRFSAQRILDDNMIPQDFWVGWGEQDYGKNFHAIGFTPKVLKALVESLGLFEDIQIKEGDINGPPDPNSWNLQLKATKARHPVVDNITPDYIEETPSSQAFWPVKLHQEYNVREMTDDEIRNDKLKWLNGNTDIEQTPEMNLFAPGPIDTGDSVSEPHAEPRIVKPKMRVAKPKDS